MSFLPLLLPLAWASALAAAVPVLAPEGALEASTQWPVNLKHTGSDLLSEAELEVELLGAGAGGGLCEGGLCEAAGASCCPWARAVPDMSIPAMSILAILVPFTLFLP